MSHVFAYRVIGTKPKEILKAFLFIENDTLQNENFVFSGKRLW